MQREFQNVNFEQNSYKASEYENLFDELSLYYMELMNGNDDNAEVAMNLIQKYSLNRDRIGFDTDGEMHEEMDYDSL